MAKRATGPHGFNVYVSTPDARALLALLKTSATFPDVVEALEEKLTVIDNVDATAGR